MAAPDRYDAITVGETMALFVSHGDPDRFLAAPAGAESNVAMNMARLGCRTRWISRLGDDPLGRLLEDRIAAAGVEVDVVRDASHPTGVMTKHITAGTPIVGYYRSQSAARELSPEDLGRLRPTRWIHVTGITPALSASARELVDAVVERRTPVRARVSFDVNLRPSLWPDTATASDVIGDLARKADVVFLGDDEAGQLFGTSDPERLGAAILRRDDQELVLKRGAGRASALTRHGEVSERALAVEVVDLNGAGDAFAAGYLAGHCFGWPTDARLRLAHVLGARAVGVTGDTIGPFTPEERAGLTPEGLERRWHDVG